MKKQRKTSNEWLTRQKNQKGLQCHREKGKGTKKSQSSYIEKGDGQDGAFITQSYEKQRELPY